MTRPGGDPILTINVKRASGFLRTPKVRDRPRSKGDVWSVGLWWLHTFVGVTYHRLDHDAEKREAQRQGEELRSAVGLRSSKKHEARMATLTYQGLRDQWSALQARRDNIDITRLRREGIGLIADVEALMAHLGYDHDDYDDLHRINQEVGSQIFGIEIKKAQP